MLILVLSLQRLTAQETTTPDSNAPDSSSSSSTTDSPAPAIDLPSDSALDLDDSSPTEATPPKASIVVNADLPVPENTYPALRQLMDLALVQAPRMQAQRAQDDAAEGNRIVARSGMLPDVDAGMSLQGRREDRLRTISATKTVPAHNVWQFNNATKAGYSIGLTQPLYYWGALRNAAQIGKLQLKVAEERTTDEYRGLVQDIRNQYLQTIIKRVTVDRMVFARKIEERQASVIEARVAADASSRAQLRRQQLRVEQAQLAEDRAKEDYRHAKVVLARLCGVDAVPDDAIPNAVETFDVTLATLQRHTGEFIADVPGRAANLAILRNQIAVENLNYRNAKVRLRPRLNFSTGISKDEQNYGNTAYAPYGVTAFYAGVSVNWSIFDGFASKGTARSALARRRDLERVYRKTVGDMADAAIDRLKQLEFAIRSMAISNRLLTATDRGLKRTKDNVQEGRASPSDIDDAQLNLYDMQISTYSIRADCLMKTTALLSTIFEDPALANLDKKTP